MLDHDALDVLITSPYNPALASAHLCITCTKQRIFNGSPPISLSSHLQGKHCSVSLPTYFTIKTTKQCEQHKDPSCLANPCLSPCAIMGTCPSLPVCPTHNQCTLTAGAHTFAFACGLSYSGGQLGDAVPVSLPPPSQTLSQLPPSTTATTTTTEVISTTSTLGFNLNASDCDS
jgi:hypothetical protein